MPLLELPNEVLLRTISYMRRPVLVNFSATCQLLRTLCQPKLSDYLELYNITTLQKHGPQMNWFDLWDQIDREGCYHLVKELTIDYWVNDGSIDDPYMIRKDAAVRDRFKNAMARLGLANKDSTGRERHEIYAKLKRAFHQGDVDAIFAVLIPSLTNLERLIVPNNDSNTRKMNICTWQTMKTLAQHYPGNHLTKLQLVVVQDRQVLTHAIPFDEVVQYNKKKEKDSEPQALTGTQKTLRRLVTRPQASRAVRRNPLLPNKRSV